MSASGRRSGPVLLGFHRRDRNVEKYFNAAGLYPRLFLQFRALKAAISDYSTQPRRRQNNSNSPLASSSRAAGAAGERNRSASAARVTPAAAGLGSSAHCGGADCAIALRKSARQVSFWYVWSSSCNACVKGRGGALVETSPSATGIASTACAAFFSSAATRLSRSASGSAASRLK